MKRKIIQKEIRVPVYWGADGKRVHFDIEGMRDEFERKLKKLTGSQYYRGY